jgi:hypothetical protein
MSRRAWPRRCASLPLPPSLSSSDGRRGAVTVVNTQLRYTRHAMSEGVGEEYPRRGGQRTDP